MNRRSRLAFVGALALDLLLLVAFAALGRNSHDDGSSGPEVLVTAAPFMIGYAASAIVTRLDGDPLSPVRAALAWAPGIGLGLLLRATVFGRGVAPAFIVVAIVTTALLILGWRVVARLAQRRGSPTTPKG